LRDSRQSVTNNSYTTQLTRNVTSLIRVSRVVYENSARGAESRKIVLQGGIVDRGRWDNKLLDAALLLHC
jgi:hypothetical protein